MVVATPRPTLRFRIVAGIVIAFVWLARWRPRTVGLEHVPTRGGAVITWNHHSHVDSVMTAWGIYRTLGRPVRHLAIREVWQSKLFGWAPRFTDAIPVSRTSEGDRDRALDDAVQALRDGHLVLVAPEGGISESFELRSFRTGAARMAQLAQVPLVPSVSWGTHRLTTTGRAFSARRGWGLPVEIAFGAPVPIGPEDSAAAVTERLRARTHAMLRDAQKRYPDGAPPGAWWVPAALGGGAPTAPDVPAVQPPRVPPEDAA